MSLIPMKGGSGGKKEEDYTSPDGVVVSSTPLATANHVNEYFMSYLFSGTETGSWEDTWKTVPGKATTLTFTFPAPTRLARIRFYTTDIAHWSGITAYSLSVQYSDARDDFIVEETSVERGIWVEIDLPTALSPSSSARGVYTPMVSSFSLDLSTTKQHIGLDSVELFQAAS